MHKLLLHNRSFRNLWLSQVISQSGNRMFQIALSWWALSELEGGGQLHLSLVLACGAIPAVLLAKTVGKMVENGNPKKILLSVDGLGTLLSLLLFFLFRSGAYNFSVIILFVILLSSLNAFIEPTLQKNITKVVRDDQIENAMAFLASTQTLAGFIGAVSGAILIANMGVAYITLLNGASFVVSLYLDTSIQFPRLEQNARKIKSDSSKTWKLLDSYPPIKELMIYFAGVNFFATASLVVVPIYIKNTLDKGPSFLSMVEALFCVGVIFGSIANSFIGMKQQPIRFTQLCLIGFSIFIGLGYLGPPAEIYAFTLALAGACVGAMCVRILTLTQQMLPESIKGRFFALMQAVVGGTIPISFLFFGFLSIHIESSVLPLLQAIGTLCIAFAFEKLNQPRHLIAQNTQ